MSQGYTHTNMRTYTHTHIDTVIPQETEYAERTTTVPYIFPQITCLLQNEF